MKETRPRKRSGKRAPTSGAAARKPRTARDAAGGSTATRVHAVASELGAAQGDTVKSGPPNASEWEKFLSKILEYGSIAYVSWLCSPFDDITDEDEEDMVMSEDVALDIAEPAARVLVRNKYARKYGRDVIESSDLLAVLTGLWIYNHDLKKIRARRRAANRAARAARAPRTPGRRPAAEGADDGTRGQNGSAPAPGPGADGLGAYRYVPGQQLAPDL